MIPAGPVVVVEPHADDAFLSLGRHLTEWKQEGRRATILTVFSGTRKRGLEAAMYAETVGAEWFGLGFIESDSGISDRPGGLPAASNPDPSLPDAVVGTAIAGVDLEGTWIGPLGIRHPEHGIVARALDLVRPESLRYVEIPYSNSPMNDDEVEARLSGRELVSWRRPTLRKYGPKTTGIFRDQAMFFRYNPPEKLARGVEIVVR